MAWIKMQTHLWDHPKVVRLLSATCPNGVRDLSAKCRIIGALYRTWSLADSHTEDGILDGYDADALDAEIGIEGWALSLQHVGWLIVEPQRIIVPRFTEHNGESAKRRAEDAKRKKASREASANNPKNVRKLSDKMRTREREEKEKSNKERGESADKPPVSILLPTELSNSEFRAVWQRWVNHRKEIKKPLTKTSAEAQLEQFAAWGQDRAIAAITHTISMGWQGIREPDQQKPGGLFDRPEPQYENLTEKRRKEKAERERLRLSQANAN